MTNNFNQLIKSILELYNKKKFKEALIKINALEKNNLVNPIIFNLKGLILFSLNLYNDALICFEEALINIDRKNFKNNDLLISILNNKGMTNLNFGNFSKAIDDFNKILKINPNFFQAYNHLGVAYENLGDREKSIKYYIKSNNLNDDYVPAKTNLIKALTFYKTISHEPSSKSASELYSR